MSEVSKAQWIEHKQILKQKREHHERKKEEAESERGKRMGDVLKSTRLKPGEDPYQWPVLQGYNRKITSHERVIEDIDRDLVAVEILIKEAYEREKQS